MLRNRGAMWASFFVFPPLGLILLWMRGDLGILRRILATLAVLTIAILELYFVYGLRLDWNGNMSGFSISFGWHAKPYSEVEANRARQQAEAPRVEEPAVERKAEPAPVVLKPVA